MAKWVSNGDYSSPNESKLLGELVVLTYGVDVIKVRRGRLKMIRANTRGNTTLAVVWKEPRADGKLVRRDVPIWTLRQRPFTIELDAGKAGE